MHLKSISLFFLCFFIFKAQNTEAITSCSEIIAACRAKGFANNKAAEGYGISRHCINPLMQGVWDRRQIPGMGSRFNLPHLNAKLKQAIRACKLDRKRYGTNPNFGGGPIGYRGQQTAPPSTAPRATSNTNTPLSEQLIGPSSVPVCGSASNSCYDNQSAISMKAARLFNGVEIEYVKSDSACSGDTCFYIWREKGGSKILNAKGLFQSANDWQKKLAPSGLSSSGDFYLFKNGEIAGRRCPPNVFMGFQQMLATNQCLYFSKGISLTLANEPGSTILQQWAALGGLSGNEASSGRGTDASYYEMNLAPCSEMGMRMPVAYETSMKKPPNIAQNQAGKILYTMTGTFIRSPDIHYGTMIDQLPGGDRLPVAPLWAEERGIPSFGNSPTTLTASISYTYEVWHRFEGKKTYADVRQVPIDNRWDAARWAFKFWTWGPVNPRWREPFEVNVWCGHFETQPSDEVIEECRARRAPPYILASEVGVVEEYTSYAREAYAKETAQPPRSDDPRFQGIRGMRADIKNEFIPVNVYYIYSDKQLEQRGPYSIGRLSPNQSSLYNSENPDQIALNLRCVLTP